MSSSPPQRPAVSVVVAVVDATLACLPAPTTAMSMDAEDVGRSSVMDSFPPVCEFMTISPRRVPLSGGGNEISRSTSSVEMLTPVDGNSTISSSVMDRSLESVNSDDSAGSDLTLTWPKCRRICHPSHN